MFKGVYTALVTPFTGDRIDVVAFVKLIERQIDAGIDGLVVSATTGECATLSIEEHETLVALCIDTVRRRVPVMVGCGSPSTRQAVALAHHAARAGADGLLAVTPYYNRPSQAGLVEHFSTRADATDCPVVLYNVPARTGVDLANETVARLSNHPKIVGLKDATGDVSRIAWMRQNVTPDFALLSGDDASAFAYLACGGDGVISVTANVEPQRMVMFAGLLDRDRLSEARRVHAPLASLHSALFSDSSPSPTKYALSQLSLCREDVRSPLVVASQESRRDVDLAAARLRHAAESDAEAGGSCRNSSEAGADRAPLRKHRTSA